MIIDNIFSFQSIAHEIAHVVLKHGNVKSIEEGDRQEKEANQLIMKWGFKAVNEFF